MSNLVEVNYGPPVQQIRPGLSNDTIPLNGLSITHKYGRF